MIRTSLKDYQQQALDIPMRRHIYAIDPGGGKTLLALAKIDELKQKHGKVLAVVLCPKTAREITWGDQVRTHSDLTYSINDFDPNVDINVFSLSKVDKLKPVLRLLEPEHDAVLIIDEAQCLCSEDSNRAFLLRGGEKQTDDGTVLKYKGLIEQFKYCFALTACPTDAVLIPSRRGMLKPSEVKKGDILLYSDRWVKVVENKVNPEEDVLRVEMEDGYWVEANCHHPVRSPGGWVALQELAVGSLVELEFNGRSSLGHLCYSFPRLKKKMTGKGRLVNFNRPMIVTPKEEDLARILGWIVGDGWISKSGSRNAVVGFCFAIKDSEIKNEIVEILRKWGFRINERNRISWSEVLVPSKELWVYLVRLGVTVGAKNKVVPWVIWKAKSCHQKVFLKYLWMSDGNYTFNKDKKISNIRFATESFELADGVQKLAGMLGVKTLKRIGSKRRITECCVSVVSGHRRRFMLEIEESSLYADVCVDAPIKKEFFYSKVLSIKKLRAVTYGIQVEGGVYNTNCIVSHNTPMINHIEDLFYLVESVFPGFFPNLEWFMARYSIRRRKMIATYVKGKKVFRPVMEVVGYKNLDELRDCLKAIMFRHVVDYPLKFYFHTCDLSEGEMSGYRQLGAGWVFESDKPKDYMSRLPELQRFVNGSKTVERRFNHEPQLTTKEQTLLNLLLEITSRGEGSLVFTECLDTMRRFELIRARLPNHTYYMTGETPDPKRDYIKRTIGPGDTLFCTGVAGVSLNFQAVNNVVLYDMDWSVGDVQQYIGRITRIDSTYLDMNVHLLTATGTIDEYKLNLFNSNLTLAKKILGGWGFLDVYFKKVERQQVMALKKSLLWGM